MPDESTSKPVNESAPSPAEQPSPKTESRSEAKSAAPQKVEAAADKPPAKSKKEKPPAPEDRPFVDFIQQDLLPALKVGLQKQDISDLELRFVKGKINVTGLSQAPECWQVIGRWNTGYKQTREFNLYFFDEDINGKKGFSYAESGGKASTLESFRIDERKADLSLLVFWTVQRLNAQKWLVRN